MAPCKNQGSDHLIKNLMAETDSAHPKSLGLTIRQKMEVYRQLLSNSVAGRFRYGSITKVVQCNPEALAAARESIDEAEI